MGVTSAAFLRPHEKILLFSGFDAPLFSGLTSCDMWQVNYNALL